MNNLNVRKGDNVKVITGKDKGKTGKVLATDPKTAKVLVEGVNLASHHRKARSATEQSGIIKVEAPLDVSNVQIVCPSCGKAVRVRHQVIDGKNVRVCANPKCGASLDAALKAEKPGKKKADKKSTKKSDKAADKAKDKAENAEKAPTEAVDTTEAPVEKPAKKPAKKKAVKAEEVPVEKTPDGKTDKE